MNKIERFLLSALVIGGLAACDDGDDGGAGGDGGSDTDGAAGAGGQAGAGGVAGMGGAAGEGGGGGVAGAGGGVGGEGGGGEGPGCPAEGDNCPAACAWFADCGIEVCEGYEEDARQDLIDGCLQTCADSAALGAIVCGHTMCEQTVTLGRGANPDFAAGCDGAGGMGGEGGGGAGGEGGAAGAGGGGPDPGPIQALFDQRCSCHTAGASGGLSLQNFEANTIDVPANGAALDYIEPGDREGSYLYHKIAGTQATVGGGGSTMPLGGSLTAEQIEQIGAYIDAL